MATTAVRTERQNRARQPLDATPYEKVLAWLALVLLATVAAALVRGAGEWARVPDFVWLHIATIGTALALTPVMLLRRRGDRLHRRLGYVWVSAMAATALITFWIRTINPGGFSWIHILSVWTLIQVPRIVLTARAHRHAAHRRSVVWMVTGALMIAGFFTMVPTRLLGHWLFS